MQRSAASGPWMQSEVELRNSKAYMYFKQIFSMNFSWDIFRLLSAIPRPFPLSLPPFFLLSFSASSSSSSLHLNVNIFLKEWRLANYPFLGGFEHNQATSFGVERSDWCLGKASQRPSSGQQKFAAFRRVQQPDCQDWYNWADQRPQK